MTVVEVRLVSLNVTLLRWLALRSGPKMLEAPRHG